MLMIRLQRIGKKKQPTYRFVISEKARDTHGRALEILGNYNPKDKKLELKEDRIKHWLSVGAQASNTVHNLLLKAGVITGKKKKSVVITNKRKAKKAGKAGEAEKAQKAEEALAEEVKEEKPAKEPNKAEEAPAEEAEEERAEELKAADKPAEEPKTEEAAKEEKKEEPKVDEEKKDESPKEE